MENSFEPYDGMYSFSFDNLESLPPWLLENGDTFDLTPEMIFPGEEISSPINNGEASTGAVATPSTVYNPLDSREESRQHSPSAEPSYRCRMNACSCNRTFRRRSELQKHIDRQTRPYACPEPDCTVKPFSTKHDLGRHQREVHDHDESGRQVPKFRCPVPTCKRHRKGFGRKENLALHIRKVHDSRSQAMHYFDDMSSGAATGSSSEDSCDAQSAASGVLSPAATNTPSSSNGNVRVSPEGQLRQGLLDKLRALQGSRDVLAKQLCEVDEQVNAIRGAIAVLDPQVDMLSCV